MPVFRFVVALVIAALVGGSFSVGGFAAQSAECGGEWPSGTIQIMAPAGPGGGWDTTAREMQQVLDTEVLDESVEVFNVEGAGGTVGLAQLVNELADDESTLMMMGLVMVGAIALNQADVSLDDVTPIARLTTEYEVVVVPADSEYQTLDDLIAAFQADPASISWAGGSAGGTDHILVGLIAQAVEVDPTQINYVAYSGGGEALAAILGGQVSAGVSGLGEWQAQLETGELRALAISAGAADSATPEAGATASPAAGGLDIPTLQEQGVDVALANWRGLVAPPEISDEVRDCMIATVEEMVGTEAWGDVLDQYGWEDFFLPGDEYGTFLGEERDRVIGILTELQLIES
ncbi:MAG: tripartite tricarboxylate transporter substrate binding protein [Chloroflexota bacterium]|nr:tripartite tricarboxylate transporter substrate binding protein [Chloroflexota bacterium]